MDAANERNHSRKLIEAHLDDAYLAGCKFYGVTVSEMTPRELRSVLAFALKNPDSVKALVPSKKQAT